MDQIAGTYNFNDNALMKLSETLKDAIDPNGILAPGKVSTVVEMAEGRMESGRRVMTSLNGLSMPTPRHRGSRCLM